MINRKIKFLIKFMHLKTSIFLTSDFKMCKWYCFGQYNDRLRKHLILTSSKRVTIRTLCIPSVIEALL